MVFFQGKRAEREEFEKGFIQLGGKLESSFEDDMRQRLGILESCTTGPYLRSVRAMLSGFGVGVFGFRGFANPGPRGSLIEYCRVNTNVTTSYGKVF